MKPRIVCQLAPRDRVRVGPNGPKSIEARDGVDHLAADLLDLKMLDFPNAAPVGGIHGGALDPITPDERVSGSPCSLSLFHDDVLHCTSPRRGSDEARQLRTATNVMHHRCPLLDARGKEEPTLALPCCRARGCSTWC